MKFAEPKHSVLSTAKNSSFCTIAFENADFLNEIVHVRDIGNFKTDLIWYVKIQIPCEVNEITKT